MIHTAMTPTLQRTRLKVKTNLQIFENVQNASIRDFFFFFFAYVRPNRPADTLNVC